MPKNWTETEEQTLQRVVQEAMSTGKQADIGYLALVLHRSEAAIYLKAYRMHLPLRPQCARPTMRLLMQSKFGDITLFTANRQFYEATRISQKRWPKLLYGYEEPTQREMEAVADYLHIDQRDWIRFVNNYQCTLFNGQ